MDDELLDLGVAITYGAEIPEGYTWEYSGPDDGGAIHYWELTDPNGVSVFVIGDDPGEADDA